MKMKKLLALGTAIALAMTTVGCGADSSAAGTAEKTEAAATDTAATEKAEAPAEKNTKLTIWATGSDNVRQSFESLVAGFNASHETQAELQFLLSGTGTQTLTDMIVAANKAGQTDTDYDLIDLSGDDLSKLISLLGVESFEKLDTSKLPNAASVTAKVSQGEGYVQPYRGTTVILAYNSETVPNPPTTNEELVEWVKANPGRFAYNTPGTGGAGDSFVRTSVYNFIDDESAATSDDEKWVAEWDKGFEFLKELHPYMYQSGGSVVYPNKNQGALDLLNQGEIDMCPNWADMVLSQRAAGTISDKIKITTITPSFSGSLQTLAIPTIGSNSEGVYEFINYVLSEEAQKMLVEQMAAIPLIDTSSIDLTGYEDLGDLDVSKFRTLSIGDLGTTFNEKWDNEIGTLK
ncbi:MAG: extracellular solute-binding protein [Clostridia bacterium]|nr:extracellular solute-binding protein [Clostridia bacterium]